MAHFEGVVEGLSNFVGNIPEPEAIFSWVSFLAFVRRLSSRLWLAKDALRLPTAELFIFKVKVPVPDSKMRQCQDKVPVLDSYEQKNESTIARP